MKYQSRSYGASSLWRPVLTTSTHVGTFSRFDLRKRWVRYPRGEPRHVCNRERSRAPIRCVLNIVVEVQKGWFACAKQRTSENAHLVGRGLRTITLRMRIEHGLAESAKSPLIEAIPTQTRNLSASIRECENIILREKSAVAYLLMQ